MALAVIGLSIWLLVDEPSFYGLIQFENIEMSGYKLGTIIMLCVAILLLFVACCGCFGATGKTNDCMLATVSKPKKLISSFNVPGNRENVTFVTHL